MKHIETDYEAAEWVMCSIGHRNSFYWEALFRSNTALDQGALLVLQISVQAALPYRLPEYKGYQADYEALQYFQVHYEQPASCCYQCHTSWVRYNMASQVRPCYKCVDTHLMQILLATASNAVLIIVIDKCHTAMHIWLQATNARKLLRSQEPILKVMLTQLGEGSGSILGVTLPHTIVGAPPPLEGSALQTCSVVSVTF